MKRAMNGVGKFVIGSLAATLIVATVGLSGCASLDRAVFDESVTWTNVPTVHVFTNTIVVTSTVPQVIERTNVVLVTNAASGAVSAYAERVALGTNFVLMTLTNVVPVFETNFVTVPVTNLVAKPGAEATIAATGAVVNTFAPGIGSILALALGGIYHGYRQIRNRKVNEALIQGVETARAILTTTPQGQAADAQFVKWLMEHQREAGVFTTVSGLVAALSDNPAARLTAQEIGERAQRAQRAGSGEQGAGGS